MSFLGETSSQTITNSRLAFIFPNGSISYNQTGVYFQSLIPTPMRVPNNCSFDTLKRRMHNTLQLTNDQLLDEIYYRKPFIDAGQQYFIQSLQLKNDDDVYTMLMCNDQYSCVGPIELLCTIIRTLDAILNLLQSTIAPTHDAIMYYGKWNIPRQGEFLGYSFTGTNPIRFGIPSGCGMEKLKDLIKQVAPTGVPPNGIHGSQLVKRLFFRQPGHSKYSENLIEHDITELKNDEDVLKVLAQSK
ncbi:hypothetical protein GmHk_12G035587 [Glycine max]|nr:hypothetical protein GmHk_12G035587 [Glycine max]